METKPFSLQSPQGIAEDYGGDKQKIAQAMQMGILDPTAATLAGMFIDRMRSAAQAERAPQQTVAQQVFTPPAPPQMPMQAPQGAPAGLGATPEAAQMGQMMAPPPAPEMPMPQEEAPPMSMADGGLASLPVPDAMFDENSNGGFDDGYAGGGILAFAGGSPGELRKPEDWGTYIEETARGLFPNLDVSGRGRTGARNTEVGGVTDSFHLIDAARDLRTPPGMTKSEFITQLKGAFGSDYDVLPSKGSSVHVEPGPALGRMVRAGTPVSQSSVPRGSGAASGLGALGGTSIPALSGMYGPLYKQGAEFYDANIPQPKTEARDRLSAEIAERNSPEQQKKDKSEDKWMMLAQLGFGLASSSSPHFLQALGSAASAALPGAAAAKKERRAQRDADIRALADIEGVSNKEARERVMFGMDYADKQLGIAKSDQTAATEIAKTLFTEGEQTERANIQARSSKYTADQSRLGYADYGDRQTEQLRRQARLEAPKQAMTAVQEDRAYKNAVRAGNNAEIRRILDEYTAYFYNSMTGGGTPSTPSYGTPPAGAVQRIN